MTESYLTVITQYDSSVLFDTGTFLTETRLGRFHGEGTQQNNSILKGDEIAGGDLERKSKLSGEEGTQSFGGF